MKTTEWPQLPIQPEDLPTIRELMSPEECEKLLKRLGWQRLDSRRGDPKVANVCCASSPLVSDLRNRQAADNEAKESGWSRSKAFQDERFSLRPHNSNDLIAILAAPTGKANLVV